MQKTGLNELREAYLRFFEGKGHLRLPSFPLVPQADKSILLINAGMTPLKPYFTGEQTPPSRRVVTCQKCIRTPDIESVGITSRHGTFFEMLGNFSFGDYFKEEAITWSWEFLTQTVGLDKALLWPSIYVEDDEAYEIWAGKTDVNPSHIVRLGKKDNFWEHGAGPCGPSSEIYFDRGEAFGCDNPDCRPGCDCDRYIEVWNNVFTQFNSDGKGTYTRLPNPNIDTGMGLERLACVVQGVNSLFEVDTIRRLLDEVCAISGAEYGADRARDISIRIVTDHVRSTVFMISDKIVPSNEGRGYVLRRLLRRAARHGKLLGINKPFLFELADVAIDESRAAYPELSEKREYIKKVIRTEEERFDATIDAGLSILNGMIDRTKAEGGMVLSGENAFKLYDTYGFPIDLVREILAEAGMTLDDDAFTVLMKEQKTRARAARGAVGGWNDSASQAMFEGLETEFTGYDNLETSAKVIALFEGGQSVATTSGEGEVTVVLNVTPFYAESGGQVGDTGTLTSENADILVTNTIKAKSGAILHICAVNEGTLNVGDAVKAAVDADRRRDITRNHSSAHLLQAALREVLGNHVEQAGSYVDAERVRFDFSHFQAMTPTELKQVEDKVNAAILDALDVTITYTTLDTAREMGAMALFGDKYGDTVRVVKMGDTSVELCGGCHVSNTAKLGLFRLLSESSVAAGIRRVEGTTGRGVLHFIAQNEKLLDDAASALKTNTHSDIPVRIEALQAEIKRQKSELEAMTTGQAKAMASSTPEIPGGKEGLKLYAQGYKDVNFAAVQEACAMLKERSPDAVVLMYTQNGGEIEFTALCGAGAVAKGANAGAIIKEITAFAGGKGGGRPERATGKGKDAGVSDKLAEKAAEILKSI